MAAITISAIQRYALDRDDDLWLIVATTSAIAAAGGHIPAGDLGATSILSVLGAIEAGGGAVVPTAPVAATATITFQAADPTTLDTILIGDNTYQIIATPAALFDVDLSATEATMAANLAGAINANVASGASSHFAETPPHHQVRASASGAVVTITAINPGSAGNSIVITASDEATSVVTTDMAGGLDAAGAGGSVVALPNTQTDSVTEDDAGDVFVKHGNSSTQAIRVAVLANRN